MNNDSKRNILAYINNPMSIENIKFLYSANNIQYDRCELYGDFTKSLLWLIFDTYLGDDVTNIHDQVKHFSWCWYRNIRNFKTEGVLIESKKLYDYFFEYTLESFYSVEKQSPNYIDKTSLRIWDEIFDYGKSKTNAEIDTLIDIYRIFEESLQNGKKN